MKVARYVRRSTDDAHQPLSLEVQKDSIANYVKSQGPEWRIVREYEDSATGRTLERDGLRRMLRDAQKKRFDVVVVYKVDRLSRCLRDFVEITRILEEAGVALKSVTEPIDTSSHLGKLLLHLLAIFAQFESDLITERTTAAMMKKAKNGEWCGGTAPFGYTYLKGPKELVRNEKEVPIVEIIFDWYVRKRMGARSIAKKLNQDGYRTRKGHRWSVDAVVRILRNPMYAGKIPRNGALYQGKHPRIICEDVWQKAQVIMDERRDVRGLRRSNTSDYLLTGLLRCVLCGARLVGVCAYGRSGLYRYYLCKKRDEHGECSLSRLPKEPLEKAILAQSKEIFSDVAFLKPLLQKLNQKLANKIPTVDKELQLIGRRIKEKRERARLYLEKFEEEKSLPFLVKERIRALSKEVDELEETRDRLQQERKVERFHPVSYKDIKTIIQNLEVVVTRASPAEAKRLLHLVIKRIDVHSPELIEPYYRIPSVRIESGLAPRTGLEPT